MNIIDSKKQELYSALPKKGILPVIDSLKSLLFTDSEKYRILIIIESHYREMRKQQLQGILEHNIIQLEENITRKKILDFISDLTYDDITRIEPPKAEDEKTKPQEVVDSSLNIVASLLGQKNSKKKRTHKEKGVPIKGKVLSKDGNISSFDIVGTYSDLSGDYMEFTEKPCDVDYSYSPKIKITFHNLRKVTIKDDKLNFTKSFYYSGSKQNKDRKITCYYSSVTVETTHGEKLDFLLYDPKSGIGLACGASSRSISISNNSIKKSIKLVSVREITFENTEISPHPYKSRAVQRNGKVFYKDDSSFTFDHVSAHHDLSGNSIELLDLNPSGQISPPQKASVGFEKIKTIEFGKREVKKGTIDDKNIDCRWLTVKIKMMNNQDVILFASDSPRENQNIKYCGYSSDKLSFLSNSVMRTVDLMLISRIEFDS